MDCWKCGDSNIPDFHLQSFIFLIEELTDIPDWPVSLWLTAEYEYAPPTQKSKLCVDGNEVQSHSFLYFAFLCLCPTCLDFWLESTSAFQQHQINAINAPAGLLVSRIKCSIMAVVKIRLLLALTWCWAAHRRQNCAFNPNAAEPEPELASRW